MNNNVVGDGGLAGKVFVADNPIIVLKKTMLITGIGYATTLAIPAIFTEEENITQYRFKPSVAMRYVEDAANVAEAEAWLNTGAADSGSSTLNLMHAIADADTWSEWQPVPEGYFFTNVYFGSDAAGTGATALVEAR